MAYLTKWEILDLLAKTPREVVLRGRDGVQFVGGALGEQSGCNAYVEDTDKNGMWRTKYFGINYWFKGITDNAIIDKVTITKKAFIWILKLFPLNIFNVKKAIASIYGCEGGLKSVQLKFSEFCPVCQEIIMIGGRSDISYCLAMFLQFSTSYRVRVQEAFRYLDKEAFEKSPLTEVLRVKHIFMGQEISEKAKMEFIWRVLFWVVAFNKKQARRMVREIDLTRARLDEADWYFCLRRHTHNFGGMSLKGRLIEAEIIDKKFDNLLLGL